MAAQGDDDKGDGRNAPPFDRNRAARAAERTRTLEAPGLAPTVDEADPNAAASTFTRASGQRERPDLGGLAHYVGLTLAGRYLVLEVLGQGATGGVFRVQDMAPDGDKVAGGRFRSVNDEYALKLHVPPSGNSSSQRPHTPVANDTARGLSGTRLLREFRMGQRRLSDSGRVTRTYHFGLASVPSSGLQEQGTADDPRDAYYFTMDLVQGGSVPYSGTPQPPVMVAALALELFTALDELHERNVVHRDLKPENLLLTAPWSEVLDALEPSAGRPRVDFPKVVLADLGIARHGAMRADNSLGRGLGTRAFLPPELLTLNNLDPRADLFAAGVVLYWLATGKHPLAAGEGREPPYEFYRGPYQLRSVCDVVSAFPPALDLAIMALLEADPTRRTPTAALAHDMFEVWWAQEPRALMLRERHALRGRPYLCTPQFVGRSEERKTAHALLVQTLGFAVPAELSRARPPLDSQRSLAARLPPCVMTVSGAAGVGKSRLLVQVLEQATELGAVVLQGQCVSGIGAAMQSLGPVLRNVHALSEHFAARIESEGECGENPEHTERIRQVERVPSESDAGYEMLLGQAQTPAEARLKSERQRRFLMEQATARLLRVGRMKPVVLVQEDSQWSDESSSAFLAFMMQGVALARAAGHPAQVAFILTHRPSSPDNAIARLERMLVEQAELERPALRIELHDLSLADVTNLAASMMQTRQSAELTRFCRELFATDTRPLFVEQTLRSLLDQGYLTRGTMLAREEGSVRWSGSWCLDAVPAAQAWRPASIHEAVGRNIEQLSAGTARALSYAAIEGREFSLDVVAHACGYEPIETLDFLDEAVSGGFVEEGAALSLSEAAARVEERRFAFRHDRYREAVYEALTPPARKEHHATVAQALVTLRGAGPDRAEVLSRHYAASDQTERAYEQAQIAAEHVHAQHAFDRAADLYGKALALRARAGADAPSELRESYAHAALSAGLYSQASEQLERMRVDERLSAEQRWDASLRLAELEYLQQNYRQAIRPLEELLRSLGETLPTTRRARAQSIASNFLTIASCAAWPRLMNRSPAASRLAEIRARAWYALAECNHFVDFTQTMFAASSVGRLAVRGGRHAFTAPALAVLTYAFAGRGLARLSRAYSSLAEEELGGLLAHRHAVDRSESLPARAAPAASARAIAHLLLLCGRLCRGELGAAHEAALQYDVQAGLRAAKQAGDPQRQWLILRVAGFALLFTGRLRGYSALSDFLVDNARISRRYHVASVCRDLASGWLADVTGEPDQSIQAFGRVVEVAGLAGSRLEVLAARARKNFLLALHASRSQPVEGVTNEARTISAAWLKGGFATCADWPLAQCFAALVLQYGHAPSVGPTLSSLRAARRACARQCRGNRVETPLYLAACAGLHLLAGKRDRARRVFEHAVYTARSEGMLMQLLDVYRVAARLYPEGDPDKEWYANAATQLAREMGRAPSSPLEALLDGSLGARLTTAS